MTYKEKAENFLTTMPYKQGEFAGRNWGHPLHSLCSYHGKLKPAIAHILIRDFTNPGDRVLDPLCGVGTIPLEACLQGRIGIGNDLSKMAYVVTGAKVDFPNFDTVTTVINKLENYINKNKSSFDKNPLPYSDFGFNGKMPEYFHKDTYCEILAARDYFKTCKLSNAEEMVFAAFMHILHGNRPYALSRNSHPLTPYKPTGDFVYKNVIEHLKDKVNKYYENNLGLDLVNYQKGKVFYGDYSKLNNLLTDTEKVDHIITSPPFTGSIRFYIQNWMRLWCAGWEQKDFDNAKIDFLESKQKKSMDIYSGFFEMCFNVLKPQGKVILHLGNSKVCNMADELEIRAAPYFNTIFKGAENVSNLEKHGIADKGATFEHQFLFLEKKNSL